jgi:hemerythrin-like domain-containing protein
MKAIEVLMNEHRVIERNLDAMEAWAEAVRQDPDPGEREALTRYVSFLREFVDERHHGKEEDILFAVMVQQGFPRERGPIGRMLHEHEIGRSLVATLQHLDRKPAVWGEEDRRQVERTVRAYARLLRDHIHQEDRVLYPLAERRLPQSVKQQVSAKLLVALLFEDLVSAVDAI